MKQTEQKIFDKCDTVLSLITWLSQSILSFGQKKAPVLSTTMNCILVGQSLIKRDECSGRGEEARGGDQLLEADEPAAQSPTGGDYITEEIDQDIKE